LGGIHVGFLRDQRVYGLVVAPFDSIDQTQVSGGPAGYGGQEERNWKLHGKTASGRSRLECGDTEG